MLKTMAPSLPAQHAQTISCRARCKAWPGTVCCRKRLRGIKLWFIIIKMPSKRDHENPCKKREIMDEGVNASKLLPLPESCYPERKREWASSEGRAQRAAQGDKMAVD